MNPRSLFPLATFVAAFLCGWLAMFGGNQSPPEGLSANREGHSPRSVTRARRESESLSVNHREQAFVLLVESPENSNPSHDQSPH